MSENNHWSQFAHPVRVMGVNGLITAPLLLWVIQFNSLKIFLFFLLCLTFFVFFENIKKVKMQYIGYYLSSLAFGSEKETKKKAGKFQDL